MDDKKIFQVSQFNEFINIYLEQVGRVTVEGEISDIRVNQGKWVFATIKDKQSSVDVFGLSFQLSGLDLLEPGMLVHVYGKPRLYQKTGRFSIFTDRIIPAGEGALKLAFEKLKSKLEKEGFFIPERKRQIPEFPEKIGLVTAAGSRAYGDFVKILSGRMGGIKIYFYPVNVQGENSAESIVRAFAYFNSNIPDLDAIALVRGGGSLEDLQSFNDEKVARAIFGSRVPVVCGVGHEDDVSISDLVSDIRASTPSNAAELMVRDRREVKRIVDGEIKTIFSGFDSLLKEYKSGIIRCAGILESSVRRQTAEIHRIYARFLNVFSLLLQETKLKKQHVFNLQHRLGKSMEHWTQGKQHRLETLSRLLSSFDMQKVLMRGFSITYGTGGKILKNAAQITRGSRITTSLFSGKIRSQVLDTEVK